MISAFRHISNRRKVLANAINVKGHFEEWEETCVPSYCHPNILAAYVSWWRLFKAVAMAKIGLRNKHPEGSNDQRLSVLDFGASVGELAHLTGNWEYHFVEEEAVARNFLVKQIPEAHEQNLEQLPVAHYDLIFALDSLEHNRNFAEILVKLRMALKPGGLLVTSGPTENMMYRLGRKIAGFDGHYHETNIYAIEREVKELFTLVSGSSLPFSLPLFRVSVWQFGEG